MILHTHGKYRLGDCEVDLIARRIFRKGKAVDIHWRGFEALRLLMEARGGIVRRDEMFKALWPEHDVDESSLVKCISQLRKALESG